MCASSALAKPWQGALAWLLLSLALGLAPVYGQSIDPLTGLPATSSGGIVNDPVIGGSSNLDVDGLPNDSIPDNSIEFDISDARVEYFLPGLPFEYQIPDTSLSRMQDYDPVFRGLIEYQTLGNLAQAAQPLLFGSRGSRGTVGFDLAGEPYILYQTLPDSLRFYRVNKPYTQASYVLGAGVQQILNFRHARNIVPNLNLALDYTRTVSEGQSSQQKAGIHNLGTSGWFRTRDRRYAVTAGFLFQSVLAEENGGAAIDSVFGFTPREAAPVQLVEAQTKNARQSFHLQQHLFGGHTETIPLKDSLSYDRIVPQWRAWHEFAWSKDERSFTDAQPDTSYYPDWLFDPDSVLVSYSLTRIENSFGLARARVSDTVGSPWEYRVRLTHRYDRIQATAGFRTEQDLIGLGQVSFLPIQDSLSRLRPLFESTGELNRKGEFDAQARAGFMFGGQRFTLGLQAQRLLPTDQQQFFFSAPYFWNQDLGAESRIVPELRYQNQRAGLNLVLKYHQVQNLLFWNESSIPSQASGGTNVWQALVIQNFHLGNWHLDNTLSVQKTSSEWINLPVYIGRHSFYYEGFFFENALFARFGMDVRYQSQYTADAWNPVTASFYIQNDRIPDTYPTVDVFFSAVIDQARIFLKGYNLAQGFFAPGWYQTPDYPMPNRGIVLGIDWRFWY